MFSNRNGMITNSAGTQKNMKMSLPSEFPQRSSGGLTSSSTTSEDFDQPNYLKNKTLRDSVMLKCAIVKVKKKRIWQVMLNSGFISTRWHQWEETPEDSSVVPNTLSYANVIK